jgi:acetolactate synthase-1/3 small subunit
VSGEPSSNGVVPAPAPAPAPAHAAPPPRALPGGGETRRHTLIAIVLDKPGVLNRVSSLMRARNFNIDSLAVSRTDQPDVSRMTITLHGDDVAVEQAAKQLYRLIDVLKVQDVTADAVVAQELALVKIRATDSNRAEILKIVELSKGRVVDLAGESVVVEVTGPEHEIGGDEPGIRLDRGSGEEVRTMRTHPRRTEKTSPRREEELRDSIAPRMEAVRR